MTPLTVAPPSESLSDAIEENSTSTNSTTIAESTMNIEDQQQKEEPTALLKQRFIFNEDITVEEFLRNSNVNVLDFVRFECGEDVDNEN